MMSHNHNYTPGSTKCSEQFIKAIDSDSKSKEFQEVMSVYLESKGRDISKIGVQVSDDNKLEILQQIKKNESSTREAFSC